MHKASTRHSFCSRPPPFQLTERTWIFSASLDEVASSVLVHATIRLSHSPHIHPLLKLQCLNNSSSTPVLHVMRDSSMARNQTPPKGLTSVTTLKKSSSKTGTVSEHCTTLGLLARDPNSCRSGISLWAGVELLQKLVPNYSPGCPPPTPQ